MTVRTSLTEKAETTATEANVPLKKVTRYDLNIASGIITFRLKNGKEAKCNVTVQTSPTSVSLNKTSISLDSNFSTEQLVATINPATSNIDTGLTWNSSNSNVATVSSQGLVTAKATGTTQITVETENGRTATCDVDVKMDSTETSNLKLNKESIYDMCATGFWSSPVC